MNFIECPFCGGREMYWGGGRDNYTGKDYTPCAHFNWAILIAKEVVAEITGAA